MTNSIVNTDLLYLVSLPEEEYIELARKRSNFDKKPSIHPERKGMLNRSKLKNWVKPMLRRMVDFHRTSTVSR
jgi:hypothetical protein